MNGARRAAAFVPLLCVLAASLAAQDAESRPVVVDGGAAPPFGLPPRFADPVSRPFSAAKFELGRALFFEPALSDDGRVSCASCHDPAHGFADPRRLSEGVHGRTTKRHAPALFNRGFGGPLFWDGRSPDLEDQVLRPIEAPEEMGSTVEAAVARLGGIPRYAGLFADAGSAPSRDAIAGGLAAFVRRITLGDSPVDRFRVGETEGLTTLERTGMWIYESRGRCWRCHGGPNFTDEDFHATGVGAGEPRLDLGREAATGAPADRGRFKTPTLRGVALSPPYFHDGSAATLEDAVEHYRKAGAVGLGTDPILAEIRLEDGDVAPLTAFLRALSRESGARPSSRPSSRAVR